MFGVGLQFHLEELLAVRRVAIPGAIAQSAGRHGPGCAARARRSAGTGRRGSSSAWRWPSPAPWCWSACSRTTTTCTRQAGHIAVGWLVVEDLFTVVVLVLLPALFGPGDDRQRRSGWPSALTAVEGRRRSWPSRRSSGRASFRWLLDYVADTRSRELFTLTVLVIALGIAVGSAVIFGVSMALGAFLAGMVVGRSDYSLRAASEALPMRDAFAVLFFVSVGMLLDPSALIASPGLVIGALAVVLVGKPLVALLLVWALRYPVQSVR